MSTATPTPQDPARGPRPFTGADRFWLRMDDPTNLMMINGFMMFDRPLHHDRLREVIHERLLPIPRFRDRVAIGWSGVPRWEFCPDMDIDEHLVRVRLPGTGDDAGLRDLASEKMSEPLDPDRPLWQFHLVENYRGGSALIGRFHHSMGDGMGMMMALLAMTDLRPDVTPSGETAGNPFLDLFRKGGEAVDVARRKAEEIMPEGMALLLKPAEMLRSLAFWQRWVASGIALSRLTLRTPDSKTPLNADLGVPKRAAWSEAIPVDAVKEIGAVMGGTVNDILLTAAAGGIRRYLIDRDGEGACKDFRATLPVNLRPLEALSALGNEFGLVYLTIPVEIADPAERLAELRKRMEQLKRSAEALVSYRVLGLMGRMPATAQTLLVRMFASKATAVITNVPGPNCQLYLGGVPVRDILFWVPRSARLSMGVSILSYAGNVRMGIATDAGLVPDPETIAEKFQQEFDAMRQLTR
jgi:WS/DGAT/MGAT family acyltransferase